MSGANYWFCPGCDRKALYAGDADEPDDIAVWHESCLAEHAAAAATAERDRIRSLVAAWPGLPGVCKEHLDNLIDRKSADGD